MLRTTYLFDLKKYAKRSIARYESGHTSVDWRLNWGHTILFYFGTVRSTPDGWLSCASRLTLFGIFPEEPATNGRAACLHRPWPRPKPRSPPHRTAVVAPPPGQSTKTPRHPDPVAAVPSTHTTLKDSHLSVASAANLRPCTLTLDTSQPAA